MEDWDKIRAVQGMQDYIVAHLDEDITLDALGEAAGYSPWHSLRLFKALTGQTPFAYIRGLRLTRAAETLRDTEDRVLDAALDGGFASHDGFTRAFERRFAMSPRQYRRDKPPVRYFTHFPVANTYRLLEAVHASEERKDSAMPSVSGTVTVTAVQRPARRLILQRSRRAADYVTYCEEMGCDWHGLLDSIPEKFDTPALLTLPPALVAPGTCATAAGVEVPASYAKPLPAGWESVDLPPCRLLYFQGMPYENEEDFGEAIGIVMEAIDGYRFEAYGYRRSDAAPVFNFGADAASGAKMAVPIE